MTFLDYSFNMLSLVGLGLGIGMMVDASIVVLESIFKKKEQGYSNLESVIVGTKEVVGAVISSMLTTIVVFIPIVLMDDEVGKMVIVLTVVIAVTLISSVRSEEHTSELQSRGHLVCRLLLETKNL